MRRSIPPASKPIPSALTVTASHAPATGSAGWGLRALHAGVALGCGALALFLAAQHPLAPWGAPALCLVWGLACWRWPDAWLAAVVAAVPVLSLALWTGWRAVDEFDLMLLTSLSAGHLRLAWRAARQAPHAGQAVVWRRVDLLALALWGWLGMGLALAWADARTVAVPPETAAGWANSLRAAKPLAYALLALPLLRQALLRAPGRVPQAVCAGGAWALAGLAAGVLWERAAFPGWLDFGASYRTVGLFWEMHVGGAAIDAFLALAMPFSVWALAAARRPWPWVAAALLAQVIAYVCLTTFARGVYGAVLGGLVVCAVLLWRQRAAAGSDPARPALPWKRRAGRALALVLVLEVAAMVVASGFLGERMDEAERDLYHRWGHWTRGVALLQTPVDWWGGLGVGRLPARYAAAGADGEFPGAAQVLPDAAPGAGPFLRLWGPPTRAELAGRYALTQQINPVPGARYRLGLRMRSAQTVQLLAYVCERHLLYQADCQVRRVLHLGRAEADWQRVELPLLGPALGGGPAWAPRLVSVGLAVAQPGRSVDIDAVQLMASGGPDLLANGGFDHGLDGWYPVVHRYFLPWHIDNLALELLIERGAIGLLLFAALVGAAAWRLVFGAARTHPAAPYLAAALASGCALGLVSSVMDMPRVAFLFIFLAILGLHLGPRADDLPRVGHPRRL